MKTSKTVCMFLFQIMLLASNMVAEIVTKEFPNPSNNLIIVYTGEDYRGKGTFYLKEENTLIKIIETDIRYGPRVNWFGNEIAEIFIPHGSPFNSSYIYNTTTKKLSDRLDNLITIFPQYDLVVFTDWEIFYFARISTQSILQEVYIKGAACSYMAIRDHFDISIDQDCIEIGVNYELDTHKDLDAFTYYRFEKQF